MLLFLHSSEQTFDVLHSGITQWCFLSGAGVFAITFAVTKSRCRMIICELDLLYSPFFLCVSYGK